MRTPTRFVTDSSLDQLARRLRFLGYDVLTHRGAQLEELFDDAARNGRTVLTSSARHPNRWAGVAAVHVGREDVAVAVRAIVAAHAPASALWSRCPRCNVVLHARSAFEARGEVPGRVTRMPGATFRSCPACGQWFWPGSHVARLSAWFEVVLGRPVASLGPSTPDAEGAPEDEPTEP
jgi:uncharacterized protein with PIN domain